MKFVHRISFRATASQRRELEALGVRLPAGIALPGGGDPFLAFDVDENHTNWPTLSTLFLGWNVSDLLRTEFSKKEIASARWLEIGAWHHGYPQPDEDVFGYRQVTYNLTDWCEQCGIGMKQKAPFQMKGEPKWGRHDILQLTWVYDELFVRPEDGRLQAPWHSLPTRHEHEGRRAQDCGAARDRRGGRHRDRGLPIERCAKCGRAKYLPVTRGPFPMLTDKPSRAMARTKEYFGSGGQADKYVLISQELVRSLVAENVRGASLRPVQSGNGKS